MRAIAIRQYGGPEVLAIEQRPVPQPKPGQVLIQVKAFGLNHAEVYFRQGAWGDVAEISGIECVGLVQEGPAGRFARRGRLPGSRLAYSASMTSKTRIGIWNPDRRTGKLSCRCRRKTSSSAACYGRAVKLSVDKPGAFVLSL